MNVNFHLLISTEALRSLAMGVLAGLGAVATPVAAQDLQAGYIVAQRFCSSCHEIERGRFRNDEKPSFAAIAGRANTTPMSLEVLLSNPHYRMPDYLTQQEIADVSAYIFCLK